MRPPLWATLAGLMDSLHPTGDAAEVLRISGVTLDLPLELTLHGAGDGLEVLAQPPGWRWSTAFDRRPARLTVELRAEAALSADSADSADSMQAGTTADSADSADLAAVEATAEEGA